MASVTQIVSIDQAIVSDHIGRVSGTKLQLILEGIDLVLGSETFAP